LAILERKFLRKVCRPNINNSIQTNEIRSNEEIYNAFREPKIIGVIKARSLNWLDHGLRSNTESRELDTTNNEAFIR